MTKVIVRSYLSPTLVLLAMDWPDGADRKDFLGFAIRRTPPFRSGDAPVTIDGKKWNWLPNRLGFEGPAPEGHDLPTDRAPIQKFMWWDARIDEDQPGSKFTYVIAPVVGKPNQFGLVDATARASMCSCRCTSSMELAPTSTGRSSVRRPSPRESINCARRAAGN
ncbi:hypothetical protein [Bradyrhizobium yuanmingense]|uniref:hypothetical protein n=1 Tax=Bradyrhizobium yuanmingense TaxID=108015 RepID=UPI0004B9988F|nr:hypothetical protein [Bradyrhizobium yuanmingense]